MKQAVRDTPKEYAVEPVGVAARIVRLGNTTFFERARRKLGITGPPELSATS